MGFLLLTEKFDYAGAAQYLDLRNLPRSLRELSGEELARQLDFIIKRGMKINVDLLSKKVTGQVVDGLPDYRDELGHLVSDEGEQVLLMQRVPGPLKDARSGSEMIAMLLTPMLRMKLGP